MKLTIRGGRKRKLLCYKSSAKQTQTKGKKSGLKHRKRRKWINAIQQNPHSREGQREDWKDKQMERHEKKKKGRPTRGRGYPSPHQMRNRRAVGSER